MIEKIVRAIEDHPISDGLAEAVQPAVKATLNAIGTPAKDALHGKWLGHPLHPALIAMPIGAWSLAFVCDVVELVNRERSTTADNAITFGVATALVSAVAGLADWSETDGRAKKLGVVHGTMNVVATALYISSLATRKRSRSKGIALSLAAFGIANASAYLGGHLSFGEQIGVRHTDPPSEDQPENFVDVLAENELVENKLVRVVAGDVAILLVRTAGKIHAIAETCTHLGGPLAEGKLEGTSVRCPWHGSRFCLEDGSALEGPTTFPVRTFDIRVQNGRVEVRAS